MVIKKILNALSFLKINLAKSMVVIKKILRCFELSLGLKLNLAKEQAGWCGVPR